MKETSKKSLKNHCPVSSGMMPIVVEVLSY
jgi:hypothetical protein